MILAEGGLLYLEVEDILVIYSVVRSCSLQEAEDQLLWFDRLDAALSRPLWHASAGADIAQQAAVLAHGIVNNHPFIDGNKRTAGLAFVTFLEENGYELTIPDEELEPWMSSLSQGVDAEDFADFLRGGLEL